MNPKEILREIISIKHSNLFLNYIVERIQDKDYRGRHITQHNRYDLDRLSNILKGIYKIVGDKMFRIPLGDDKGIYNPDCNEYYQIVKSVKDSADLGTINSLKKNFFVDFHRMGLLNRFNIKQQLIPPNKRGVVHYAKLTDKSLIFLKDTSIIERHKIFTDAIDKLFGDAITQWAETIYYSNYKKDRIGIFEFMLILSDDRPGTNKKKISLIDSFRELERWQREKAIELIRQYCNPSNFKGNKTIRRDFGNWKNEIQQIFTLLKNTVYFDITENSLRLNTGTYGIFSDKLIKKRSLGAKREYFKKHRISDKIRRSLIFELDHVVPFSSARNKVEFKLIDNWQNLIYLKKDKHAEKTKNDNKNMVLSATPLEIHLDDIDGKSRITAKNGRTALYEGSLVNKMQKYNQDILKEVFGFTKS
ncbi:MAG: hypothetical protein L0Y79_04895 [Chlorobi bacterium]|nr:hypothetical protein [Chlorobiota bacterium]MCI0716599.1 hypothetical protein [Chlorobiota bacterium]